MELRVLALELVTQRLARRIVNGRLTFFLGSGVQLLDCDLGDFTALLRAQLSALLEPSSG